MKKTFIILGALLIAVLIAAGSFWGGMAYQTRKVSQARADFFNARGGNGGQALNGGQFQPRRTGRRGFSPVRWAKSGLLWRQRDYRSGKDD